MSGLEICDGLDNDCDGQIDEGLGHTVCGVGECRHSVDNCVNGVPQECISFDPQEEICDNKDNNCDGHVDVAPKEPGIWESLQRPCSTICGEGEEICYHGEWKYCDALQPTTEVCDNKDNNCDGQIDEGMVDCYPVIYAVKTQGFPYYSPGKCIYGNGYAGTVTVSGQDLLDCDKVNFVSSSVLTVAFDYKAKANSCWQKPTFILWLQNNTTTFVFPDCNSESSSSLSIAVPVGVVVDDLSFILTPGDWGATVKIKSVDFN